MAKVNVNELSETERKELLKQLSKTQNKEAVKNKKLFEKARTKFINDVKKRLNKHVFDTKNFKEWLRCEAESFQSTLKDYGKLNREEQLGFTVQDESFKVIVKGNRIKRFDERADVAEKRLVDFLNKYIEQNSNGKKNPIYTLAMSMIQRNEIGDLDYKSISKLYELEVEFNDSEYTEIMNLFRESNVVEGTVINFYFEEKDSMNNWKKIEPSFNRI